MSLFKRLFDLRPRQTPPTESVAPSPAIHEDASLWDYGEIPKDADTLIALLDSGSSKVRVAAARALGRLGDERAVNPLIRLLGDTWRCVHGEYVRREAAEALNSLGEPQWLPLIKGSFYGVDVGKEDFERLAASTDSRATEPLIYVLTQGPQEGDYEFPIAAARLLGERGDKRAIPALRAALDVATFDRFQRSLIEALRLLGDGESNGGKPKPTYSRPSSGLKVSEPFKTEVEPAKAVSLCPKCGMATKPLKHFHWCSGCGRLLNKHDASFASDESEFKELAAKLRALAVTADPKPDFKSISLDAAIVTILADVNSPVWKAKLTVRPALLETESESRIHWEYCYYIRVGDDAFMCHHHFEHLG